MGVVQERLRGTHGPPGKAARLGGMVHLFRWQTGDEVAYQLVDDMVPVRFDHFRILVFGVFEITGHAVAVQQVRQLFDIPGVEPTRDQRRDILTIFAAKLGTGRWTGRVVAPRLASHHFMPVDVVGDSGLGGEGAGLVDRGIDILPAARDRAVYQGGQDGHVGEVTAHVPGIATARGNGRGAWRV